ncbi:MAG: cell division protein FtsA [Bacteroidales bacterium]|nr:cell division protein FtsA [Bacteroidales bacterium]
MGLKKEMETQENGQPKLMVGLDIGTTKIAVIVGYESDGKIDIVGYGKAESLGVQHGLIYNVTKTTDGINTAKEQAEARIDNFMVEDVFVGIAGRHIKSIEYKHVLTRLNGKDRIIQQDEIDQMLKDLYSISVPDGEQIITVIPQRYVIDHSRQTYEPVGELGEIIEGYYQLVTGNEREINKILMCVGNAQLKTKDIILEPIASGLSCLSDEEKKRGVALIDIGGGTTDLIIYYEGNPVFTKVIPIGGSIITKDIAQICSITEELAEDIKKKHGTCIVANSNSDHFISLPQFHAAPVRQINEAHLATIINYRVQNDILNKVKEEIENSGYANKLLAGVVLTGGGSTLRHIKELCAYTLQKSVRIGNPEMGFLHNIPAELKNPMYATSLGLLKYGILQNKIDEEENPEEQESITPKKTETEKKKAGKTDSKPKGGNNGKRKGSFFGDIQKWFEDIIEPME